MGNRQMSRALGVAPSTIQHHLSRLGRHCMLFQFKRIEGIPCAEVIAIDGLETFEFSQYHPFHINVAVEVDTGFILFHTDSPLRRKGRMTAAQKRRRLELEARDGRPDPKAVQKGIRALLEAATRGRRQVGVRSDDHKAYPPAMRRLACRIDHQVTPSSRRRDRHNALFEINALDNFTRHSAAAHKRETIAFAKRRQAAAENFTTFLVFKNYLKRRWEKGPPESAAMHKGLTGKLLDVRELLAERLFRTRIHLPPPWDAYYDRRVITPALGVNRTHQLTYAY
jgi:hypothetical protein